MDYVNGEHKHTKGNLSTRLFYAVSVDYIQNILYEKIHKDGTKAYGLIR